MLCATCGFLLQVTLLSGSTEMFLIILIMEDHMENTEHETDIRSILVYAGSRWGSPKE